MIKNPNYIDQDLLKKSIKEFRAHFDEENNIRVIFSGPFGTGKTTFLNSYFEQDESYQAIRLFPVNYSVASNEDIFQLIKHDILFQLLDTDIEFEKIEFTHLETLGIYIPEKTNSIFSTLLSFIPKTGNTLVDNVKSIHELYKNYTDYHSKIKIKDEKNEIKNFLEILVLEKGSIYEEDFITLLIKDLIGRLKDIKKKTVLIIDDLDRLDPDHIFRILNVFSAHFDQNGKSNKFDFDSIILVCDIENIRTIFKHKYGLNSDFSGYIDKFYSRDVFNFTNHYSLLGWLEGLNKVSRSKKFNHLSNLDIEFIFDIVNQLVVNRKISFRNLLKLDYEKVASDFERLYSNSSHQHFFNLQFTKVAYLLKILYGDLNSLFDRLRELHLIHSTKSNQNIGDKEHTVYKYYDLYLFPVLSFKFHNFKQGLNFQFNHDSTMESHVPINLTTTDNGYLNVRAAKEYPYAHRDFWADMEKSIKILREVEAV